MPIHEMLNQLRVPELVEVRDYLHGLSTSMLVSMGTCVALTTYWYSTRPKALKPPCDLHMQSIEVPGGEFARRSALVDADKLLTCYYEDATTVYEVFTRGLRVSKNGPCLGWRRPNQTYEWLSYSQVSERAENLGCMLLHKGHSKTKDPYIGIFAQNRPEWTVSELACYTYSLTVVPLYETLGTKAIDYIINKIGISTLVCDVPAKACLLLDIVSGKQHSLKTLILMEDFHPELAAQAQKCGVNIISLKDAEGLGKAHWQHPVPPNPDDMAIICCTSGTTGNPKGAMLTHKNIVANISGFVKLTETSCRFNPSDTHISYLPLAHMYERVMQGDMRCLMDDIRILRPTVFPAVPRVLNKMFDQISGQANTPLKKWILEFAIRQKEAEMRRGIMRRNSVWDILVFKKFQDSVGGRMRLMLTGAAPLSSSVLTCLRAALGCQFYESYGQTECTADCAITVPGDWTAGHVGPPLPCNFIKLVDVAEMNYLAVNGEGEVCVKGPNVFKGYLKDPEKTKEAIDQDGWLHTGDIGKWLPNGTLKLVDRKKHIFKLAQGEYIAPEKIENIYIQSEAVAQVFVHGDSRQAFLVAIVVPDPDFLPGWAKRRGLTGSYEELCNSKEVKNAILEEMVKLGKESGLKSFEQVKDIALHTDMFSIQNGLLTPTLKAKRAELRNHFRQQIDQLYSKIHM